MESKNLKNIKVWLDDTRPAPEGWVRAHNLKEVQEIVDSGVEIEEMSFDYDLGYNEPTGLDVAKWLAEKCRQDQTDKYWPGKIRSHSAYPGGPEKIMNFVKDFEAEFISR